MNSPTKEDEIADDPIHAEINRLLPAMVNRAPGEAARMLQDYPDDFVVGMLASLNPALAQSVLERFSSERRQKLSRPLPRKIGSNGSGMRVIRKTPSVT